MWTQASGKLAQKDRTGFIDRLRINNLRQLVSNSGAPAMRRLLRHNPKNVVPMGRAGGPDEVAKAVVRLASDGASYVHGSILDVAGGR